MSTTTAPDDIKDTTSSAARVLNCSEAYVRKLADSGALPYVRTASGVRIFNRHDLVRLAEERGSR